MNGQPKSTMDVLEVCERACAILKKAGFVVKNVSMRSEATYFRFPGRDGVIRVSAHPGSAKCFGLDKVLGRLTFSPDKATKIPGCMKISDQAITVKVMEAIGRYMVLSDACPTCNGTGAAKGDVE